MRSSSHLLLSRRLYPAPLPILSERPVLDQSCRLPFHAFIIPSLFVRSYHPFFVRHTFTDPIHATCTHLNLVFLYQPNVIARGPQMGRHYLTIGSSLLKTLHSLRHRLPYLA